MLTSEEKILIAAKSVFIERGFSGARMQEIADRAGMNKGLLHYYFQSKEKLFNQIFEKAIFEFIPILNSIFESSLPLFEKIEEFISKYIDFIIEHPEVPGFILHELKQNPQAFLNKIKEKRALPNPMKLITQLQIEIDKGIIRTIQPIHLLVNIISMCIFPFVGKPMLKAIFQMDEESFSVFLFSRKKEIYTFVKSSLIITQIDNTE